MKFFDLHCDTLTKCYENKTGIENEDYDISLKKTLDFDEYSQFFAVFIPDELRGQQALDLFLSQTHIFYHTIFPLKTDKFIPRLSVEGGAAIAGNLNNINILKQNNVEMLTLSWNGLCEIASGWSHGGGLSELGIKAVELLEKNDITVDVSHLSDKGFYDLCSIAKKPFVASHSNSATIMPVRRNLTDHQFLELKRCQGIVGMNFCRDFVSDEAATIDDLIKHIEYFLSLGGEDIVAMGSDYDGAPILKELITLDKISLLQDRLLQLNYNEDLTQKIMYKNAKDFFNRKVK